MADLKQIKVGNTTYNIEPYTSYLPLTGGVISGTITLPINTTSLKFRDTSDYETGTFYGTSGNEALTFYAKSIHTSFQFISGTAPSSASSWKDITPGLQIKNNKVVINKKLGDGASSDYNLEVAGTAYITGQIRTDSPLFAYGYYNGNNNRAAIVWDKPGSNYSGLGAHTDSDTIFFGACNIDGSWVDTFKQKWKFNGSIQTEKLIVSSETTAKATMQYNSTEDCIEFIFA